MPQSKPNYRRGEIWWVSLDPVRGNEAKKRCDPNEFYSSKERAPRQTRPCLILQNDLGNQYSSLTLSCLKAWRFLPLSDWVCLDSKQALNPRTDSPPRAFPSALKRRGVARLCKQLS